MADKKKIRAKKPLKKRTIKERLAAKRLLHGRNRRGPEGIYDPEIHPAGIVAYFRERFDKLKESVELTDSRGRVSHVKAPVSPPTCAGYAAKIGVCRETIWSWGEKYTEFQEALGISKAMQEQIIVELGLEGAYNPNFAMFVLKNLQQWKDKVETIHTGGVILQIDEQDLEA